MQGGKHSYVARMLGAAKHLSWNEKGLGWVVIDNSGGSVLCVGSVEQLGHGRPWIDGKRVGKTYSILRGRARARKSVTASSTPHSYHAQSTKRISLNLHQTLLTSKENTQKVLVPPHLITAISIGMYQR